MIVLGIESSCDETGVALVEADAGGVPRLRSQALHTPDRACTRPTAAWCPSWRRATTCGACCRCCEAALADAALDASTTSTSSPSRAGPGLAGALLVGAGVACALAASLGQADAGRAPPRRPPAVAVPVGRSAGVPVRGAAGVGRPHAADARRRRRPLRDARRDASTTPPARPSTSRPSCSGCGYPGRPGAGARSPSTATRGRSRCRGPCCTAATSTSRSRA